MVNTTALNASGDSLLGTINASGDFLRTSGIAVSGWAVYTTSANATNIASTGATNAAAIVVNTTALNASGDFLRTSGIAVSGWAVYTTSANATNIASTGATNAAAIVVNTTALNASGDSLLGTINASGDFLRTSGIAVSGWAVYTTSANATNIASTGATNAAAIVVKQLL